MSTVVLDSFTGTNGTLLTDHSGETGATWANHPSYTGTFQIASNRCRSTLADGTVNGAFASGTPATAEYDVSASIVIVAASNAGALASAGLCGRMDESANTLYQASLTEGTGWRLHKFVGGSATQLGSTVSQTLSNGQSYAVKLEIREASKKLFVGGVEKISSTDNAITATGKAGVRGRWATDSGGYHYDAFTLTDLASGTTYTEPLTSLADTYATVTDIGTFVDAAQALVTATISTADTVAMLESILTTAQAADSVSDLAQRAESLLAVIQAADSVQSAQAMVEALIATSTAQAAVSDSQAAAGAEALITVVTAADSVQDVVSALEQFTATVNAVATVNDSYIAAAAENLLTAATSIASVTNLQLMVDNLTIMATSSASIGEIAAYLEQLASAAIGETSVTDVLLGAFIGRYLAVEYAPSRVFQEYAPSRTFYEYVRPRGRS